jgi:3-hydroxyisobutyrate dehydrogenase
MRIAVLGAGIMGAPIARRLTEAGHGVRSWNRTRDKAEGLGCVVADEPGGAIEGAEVVITMLADGPAVDETMRAALAGAKPAPDAVWIQTSTVGIDWTRRLAELAAEHGLLYVDAPVLGTRKPAEEGQLAAVLAGPEQARPVVEEVLTPLTRKTVWLGEEVGDASALKLVVNHWIMNTLENIAETVALAQALGVDPQRFLESIEGGGMDMPYAHQKTATITAGDFTPSFTAKLAEKDVGLIVEAARAAGVELALAEATRARLGQAIELGHGDDDVSATYLATRPKTDN